LRRRCLIGDAASLHRDESDFLVFRFSKSEDAEAFAQRFGAESLVVTCNDPKNKRGDPKAAA
jgi:hypothetical protein